MDELAGLILSDLGMAPDLSPEVPPEPSPEPSWSDRLLAEAIANAEPGRPRWHSWAACRGAGPALFFSDDAEALERREWLCEVCPVAEQCLAAAMGGRELGWWAGTTAAARRRLRREAAA